MTTYDTFKSRAGQALPKLDASEVRRIERFGARACYRDGALDSWLISPANSPGRCSVITDVFPRPS